MTTPDHDPSHPVFAAVYDPVMTRVGRVVFEEHRTYLTADLHGAVLDLGAGTGALFPYFETAAEHDPSLSLHAISPVGRSLLTTNPRVRGNACSTICQ